MNGHYWIKLVTIIKLNKTKSIFTVVYATTSNNIFQIITHCGQNFNLHKLHNLGNTSMITFRDTYKQVAAVLLTIKMNLKMNIVFMDTINQFGWICWSSVDIQSYRLV